jgi:hypothetical protein
VLREVFTPNREDAAGEERRKNDDLQDNWYLFLIIGVIK